MEQQLQRHLLLLVQVATCSYHVVLILLQLLVLLLQAYLYLEPDHDK